MEFARKLARQPFAPADYAATDAEGHVIAQRLMGPYAFSFWIDHAACLVMIAAIESAD